MKKIFLSLFLSAFILLPATAQREEGTLSIVPRLGVNVSNVGNNKVYYLTTTGEGSQKSKASAGITIGADAEYQLTDLLYLSAGLNYSLQRCKFDNLTMFDNEDATTEYFTGVSDHKLKMGYLHLPVTVGCYVYNTLSVKLGLQLGFLTSANESIAFSAITRNKDTGERTYTDPKRQSNSITGDCNRLELGIPVGVSYEYENVQLTLQGYYGLTNALKNQSSKNTSLSLTVGYRFDISKFDLPFNF